MTRRLLFLLALPAALAAVVYTPRIRINGQVDFYSLQTVLDGILKPGMNPREKAEAVWRFSMAPMFHYKSPEEGLPGNAVTFEMNTVEDPLKLLNVYGYAYCFSYVSITSNLWRLAGLDSTRIWGIHGHLISEVFYDGGWHYYDADQSVSACFLKADGKTVASAGEIQNDPEGLIVNPKFKATPCMPYDAKPIYLHESRKALALMFGTKDDNYIRDRYGVTLHHMDYGLRKNESLTLFFDKQGRWRHNGMDWAEIDPSQGPYDAHGARTYSNGVFEYRPDFGDTALPREGFYHSENVRCAGSLELADPAGAGEVVIKISSPYIITGTPVSPSTDLRPDEAYRGAAVVSGHLDVKDRLPAEMEISPADLEILAATDDTFGAYKRVYRQSTAGFFTVDLSELFSMPVYYYYLKIIFKKARAKNAREPFVGKLSLKTWVQVNPASIPRLEPGVNRIAYSAQGPAVDKVDVERCFNTDTAMNFLYASKNASQDSHVSRKYVQKNLNNPAWLVFEMASPEGEMADYYASALFHMREGTQSALFVSENDTSRWNKVSQAPKLHNEHWADWLSPTFTASQGVRKVYFKVLLNGGASLSLFNYGYRYHYRASAGQIEVVQGAEVDGKTREYRWPFNGAKGETRLTVKGKTVVNRYLRYECR